MITTSDFKKGCRLSWKEEPYVIVDCTSQSPSARGGATLVKVKMKNILTGQLHSVTFKSGEKFETPDLEYRSAQFLYLDGETFHFMDSENYEQIEFTKEALAEEHLFLSESLDIRLLFWNGSAIGVELPNSVVHTITQCDPGIRGDTVNNVTKEATTETGLTVQVPLFVEQDERIRIDTRDGRYLERAKD